MPELDVLQGLLAAPLVGSFLALLATRLPAGRPVVFDRSRCDHCDGVLRPSDLVPLLSWLLARGRCRHCNAVIGSVHPLMELAALGVALWAASAADGWLFLASCALGWCLLVLTVIDLQHFILPDEISLTLVPGGLLVAYAIDPVLLGPHSLGALAGFSVFAATRWLYARLRGRAGLGLGDAKLLAGAGAWLSWQSLPSVVLIAALTGLALVALRRAAGRRISATERLPFGPCICIAIWLVWLYGRPMTG